MEAAPPVLIVKGDLALLDRQAVAMVGARNASRGRLPLRARAGAGLGQRGCSSSPAWRAASTPPRMTARSTPARSAVIAGGIDVVYPPENEERQRAIAERGLLIAEMPPGTEPRARHFPYRNRIIAGLRAGHGGGRGGAAIGLADHRAARRRIGPRGDGGARLAARSARPGLQPADPRRRDPGPECGGRAGGDPPAASRRARVAGATIERRAEEPMATTRRGGDRGLLGPTPVAGRRAHPPVRRAGGAVQMVLLELELAGRLERHAGGEGQPARPRLTGSNRRPHLYAYA